MILDNKADKLRVFSWKSAKKLRQRTVITGLYLRYYSMSDIFGLAYLVGQIED
jgi:hypothetical protein